MPVCTSCGESNPARARFCMSCAAPLPTPAPVAGDARKTVTVLFCDVVGSTPLGERLEPESVRRVMTRFFEEMRAVIERHGGTVEKYIGDAVVAFFGTPVLARGRRPAGGARGRGDGRGPRDAERRAGAGLGGLAAHADRGQHRRGGRGRLHHGRRARRERRGERGRAPGADRRARRGPVGSRDVRARAGDRHGGRGQRVLPEGEGRARDGLPAPRGRARIGRAPSAAPGVRRAHPGTRGVARGARCERPRRALRADDGSRRRRGRQVPARPRVRRQPRGRGPRGARALPPLRRRHHLLARRRAGEGRVRHHDGGLARGPHARRSSAPWPARTRRS